MKRQYMPLLVLLTFAMLILGLISFFVLDFDKIGNIKQAFDYYRDNIRIAGSIEIGDEYKYRDPTNIESGFERDMKNYEEIMADNFTVDEISGEIRLEIDNIKLRIVDKDQDISFKLYKRNEMNGQESSIGELDREYKLEKINDGLSLVLISKIYKSDSIGKSYLLEMNIPTEIQNQVKIKTLRSDLLIDSKLKEMSVYAVNSNILLKSEIENLRLENIDGAMLVDQYKNGNIQADLINSLLIFELSDPDQCDAHLIAKMTNGSISTIDGEYESEDDWDEHEDEYDQESISKIDKILGAGNNKIEINGVNSHISFE
ncbi:MAG: hypothetical protein Q4P34_02770 [Tissierellia bacterium]|nr:hypothetical protein [Tissierellia bacterium]